MFLWPVDKLYLLPVAYTAICQSERDRSHSPPKRRKSLKSQVGDGCWGAVTLVIGTAIAETVLAARTEMITDTLVSKCISACVLERLSLHKGTATI